MAIHESLKRKITSITEDWQDHTGQEVEDFVCRNFITGGEYDSVEEKLHLFRKGNDDIEIDVSVQQPYYDYGIILYGIKINGVVQPATQNILTQYRDDVNIELGIAIKSVSIRSEQETNINKPFNLTANLISNDRNKSVRQSIILDKVYPISHEYFKLENGNLVLNIPEGESAKDIVVWRSVKDLFKKSFQDCTIECSFTQPDSQNNIIKYSDILGTSSDENVPGTNITNEIIKLVYKQGVTISDTKVTLEFEGNTNSGNYRLSGFVNTNGNLTHIKNLQSNDLNGRDGEMSIRGLNKGLNQFCIRAIHVNDSNIYTDWLYFDVIVKSQDDTNTYVAVNEVKSELENNGKSDLYKLTIYSPTSEEIQLTTYLEETYPDEYNPNPKIILKSETINPASYDIISNEATSTYQKYIELENNNITQYLLIKINDDFYKFYTADVYLNEEDCQPSYFKSIKVDKINPNFTYVKHENSLNFDQITGQVNNVFITKNYGTSNISSTLESSDGWYDEDGRTYFKVSAQNTPVFINNGIDPKLTRNFTLELGLKTYNASDKDDDILTLGKIRVRPDSVCWYYDKNSYTDLKKWQSDTLGRISKFQEGVETHIVITVQSNWCVSKSDLYYPDYLDSSDMAIFEQHLPETTANLVRIFINGVIDREYIITDNDLNDLITSYIQINPKFSDVNFYLLRVYPSKVLNFSEIIKNRISFFSEKSDKENFYNHNDILDDYTGKISWEKCLGKLNTLLYVFPEGGRFPNRFWGGPDNDAPNINKKLHTSLFINYADPNVNAKYGGRLNKLQVKSQGSSASRYLIWNVGSQVKKHEDAEGNEIDSVFTPQGLLDPTCIPENYTNKEALIETTNYYKMPPYEDQVDKTEYEYKKLVGKVNYASSMQSHKIGACKLYDDAFKSIPELKDTLPSGGRKAVHEEPYMYFYLETTGLKPKDFDINSDSFDNDTIANLSWEDLMKLKQHVKFMGFQTWGPGKGDKACSGYDEEHPEYLMLEGGENEDETVNFLVPWNNLQRGGQNIGSLNFQSTTPTVSSTVSLEHPEYGLVINDESVCFKSDKSGKLSGAWDIDFGCHDNKIQFEDDVLNSLKKFREFYDLVYTLDFTFVFEQGNVTTPAPDWDKAKKHLVAANTFTINGESVPNHKRGDVYRWDPLNNTWVRAGLFYNHDITNDWDRLNYVNYLKIYTNGTLNQDITGLGGTTISEAFIRRYVRTKFIEHVQKYLQVDDIAFHQAFIKYLSGTDNRAKNTYFQIIGPNKSGEGDYKIRLIGDDLDTILAIDNNGLQTKTYNLVENSFDSSFDDTWGDKGNIFLIMFDLCFEDKIKYYLGKIMDKTGMSSDTAGIDGNSYFHKVFFNVQKTFPAIAYNHTAQIYYENAYALHKAVQQENISYSFDYTHNGVEPLSQSHGSSLEAERQFMKERVGFLSGYGLSCLAGRFKVVDDTGGSEKDIKLVLEFEPNQDFYPAYSSGSNDNTYHDTADLRSAKLFTDTNNLPSTWEEFQLASISRRKIAKKGESYKLNIEASGIHHYLFHSNLFKSLSITGLTTSNLTGVFDRSTDFTIDNNKLKEYSSFFGTNWTEMSIRDSIKSLKLPIVENLNLNKMVLPDTTDLSNYYKLKNLNLLESNTKYVVFPRTGKLSIVKLPATIEEFRIYDNPGLQTVDFESLQNLKKVYIDCDKCGNFDVADFCEKIKNSPLKSVTLKNANFSITEETFIKLINVETVNITGKITIINSINNKITKEISFETKQLLVEKFGDIDTGSNGLTVIYESSNTISLTFPKEVNVYYKDLDTTIINPFIPLNIIGNNINIIQNSDSNSGYTLDIIYNISGDSNVQIDSIKGNISFTSKPAADTYVNLIINNESYQQYCKLIFEWTPPKIGQFVYNDGTFSFNYVKDQSKKPIGLIYDKKETNDSQGIIYVIGLEKSNDHKDYPYFTSDDNKKNPEMTAFYSNIVYHVFGNTFTYPQLTNNNGRFVDRITTAYKDNILTNPLDEVIHEGLDQTRTIVEWVNKNVLPKITKFLTNDEINSYLNSIGGAYSIKDINSLNALCNKLNQTQLFITQQKTQFNSSILFPYFYSSWLYSNNFGETQLQWHAPGYAELAKIIYQVGYSSYLDSFSNSTQVMNSDITLQNITTSINSYKNDTFHNTPVFAIAYSASNTQYFWEDIIKEYPICTANAGDKHYGYVETYNFNGNYKEMTWQSGIYDYYNQTSTPKTMIWAYGSMKTAWYPFTAIEYEKPDDV